MRDKRTTAALLISLLALAAAGVSAYLAWKSITAGPVAGCGAIDGPACDEILASRWSKWFGVPVSLLAVGVYLMMIPAAWAAALRPGRATLALLACLSLSAFGAGAWFVGVQAVLLHGFCPWCLAVHVCAALTAVLTFYLISAAAGSDEQRAATLVSATVPGVRRRAAPRRASGGPLLGALGAVLGVAALVGGQLASEDESPAMQEVVIATPDQATSADAEAPPTDPTDDAGNDQDQPTDDDDPVAAPTEDGAPPPLEPIELSASPEAASGGAGDREFRFVGLSEPVDLDQMPVLGSRDAKHVMVEVVDYTCKHCRALHPYVKQALEDHDGQVAVVVHNLPLNPACNPNFPAGKEPSEAARHACDYARLAISVWRLAPDKFPAYHDWLMEGDKPPRITKARVRAADLVGDDVLLSSKLRDEVANRINDQCTSLKSLKGGLPVMLFEYSAVQGVPKDPDAFDDLLRSKFGL
ncbi:Vitamin K epoxide reductase family protein [Posidoniimonas corsicana]|uniref:Vitamin K epoxide reductase family protein n=1 Tax=Posidoniimonas corsicana TaxID=1938618 RepID=A0A5C5VH07_9BACT|nr:vitamin K epoxide reductase family protein [Posidoniimonas corsicana]TWT36942.1 Vitamin K epoxide reductase family protein [Posidoniimonas corsicana]